MACLQIIRDAAAATRRIELFEPAMCCPTGLCGPAVDQQLIDIRDDLRWAEGQGAEVARHNLSSVPLPLWPTRRSPG